jgi:integrase
MKEQKVSVSFYLEKTKPNNEGKCLIKMVVYCNPSKKRYSTNEHITEAEWDKMNGSNLRDNNLKNINAKLGELRAKASKIIDTLSPFSFIAFEEAFYDNVEVNKNTTLQHWFDSYINKLKAKDCIGTAIAYRTTINSINLFKKNLHLQDITPNFLEEYEAFLSDTGKSNTSISIYMRQLRAIINQAIEANILPQAKYPFKKYEIPASSNVKKALSNDDVSKLLKHRPKKEDEEKALDFWILSYLCSGINFADIIQLKPSNIIGNHLVFIRAKTKNTKKKDLRPIKVGLHPRALEIIEKWKNKNATNPYLFPVLEPNLAAITVKRRCQRFIKWVNDRMDLIRLDLKIEQKVGTYAARHSFSTVLKRKGASTEFISESLGHSSVIVTANYLDSFTDDTKLDRVNLLTDF